MQDAEIYERLTDIFHQVFDDDRIVLSPATTADDVEGWDSLRNIHLVMTIEKVFRVKLSAGDLDKMNNVGDMVQLVKSKL